jgi:hypothetical protein
VRQKTKNLRNQGSFDKKIDFFSKTLSHIPRWVHLEQKTRAKNSHAWAPLINIMQFYQKYCITFTVCLASETDSHCLVHCKKLVLSIRDFISQNRRRRTKLSDCGGKLTFSVSLDVWSCKTGGIFNNVSLELAYPPSRPQDAIQYSYVPNSIV